MIRFLKQLLTRFAGWALQPKLRGDVQSHEPLTRFIFSREHFAETKGLVKPKAFLPDQNGETSVFRTAALSSDAIWAIGNAIRGEKAKARGDLATAVVQRIGLRINPATEEHPKHAVIVGWPAEKDKKLMMATLLSKETTLRVPE